MQRTPQSATGDSGRDCQSRWRGMCGRHRRSDSRRPGSTSRDGGATAGVAPRVCFMWLSRGLGRLRGAPGRCTRRGRRRSRRYRPATSRGLLQPTKRATVLRERPGVPGLRFFTLLRFACCGDALVAASLLGGSGAVPVEPVAVVVVPLFHLRHSPVVCRSHSGSIPPFTHLQESSAPFAQRDGNQEGARFPVGLWPGRSRGRAAAPSAAPALSNVRVQLLTRTTATRR
jgi:hypothetical protein